jgi:hypothetical protein
MLLGMLPLQLLIKMTLGIFFLKLLIKMLLLGFQLRCWFDCSRE